MMPPGLRQIPGHSRPTRLSNSDFDAADECDSQPLVRLQFFHLVEGARDANPPGAEVDRHGGGFYLYDATQTMGVVGDQVVQRVLLDRWLGVRLEGATGQLPPYWSCHPLEYLPGLGTNPERGQMPMRRRDTPHRGMSGCA